MLCLACVKPYPRCVTSRFGTVFRPLCVRVGLRACLSRALVGMAPSPGGVPQESDCLSTRGHLGRACRPARPFYHHRQHFTLEPSSLETSSRSVRVACATWCNLLERRHFGPVLVDPAPLPRARHLAGRADHGARSCHDEQGHATRRRHRSGSRWRGVCSRRAKGF